VTRTDSSLLERDRTAVDAPPVSVVVLHWRGLADTLACLESLMRLDYPSSHVIVVDNGSGDDLAAIRRQFPQATVVENGRNLGFAGGSNVGIARALADGAEYVFLLNNDTEVAPDLLSRIVDAAESDPSIGIIGPTVLYYDPSDVIWSAGGTVGPLAQTSHLDVDERLPDRPIVELRDVDYVTGCALLVSRAVVERIGVLDERFFAYFEEVDLCARAREAGFRVVHAPTGRVWHKIERTARAHSRFYLYLMARNRLLYLRCRGAPLRSLALAALDLLRTSASWTLRARHREMRPYASALPRGVGAFLLGRFGAPPRHP
jgi:hypothetical protein